MNSSYFAKKSVQISSQNYPRTSLMATKSICLKCNLVMEISSNINGGVDMYLSMYVYFGQCVEDRKTKINSNLSNQFFHFLNSLKNSSNKNSKLTIIFTPTVSVCDLLTKKQFWAFKKTLITNPLITQYWNTSHSKILKAPADTVISYPTSLRKCRMMWLVLWHWIGLAHENVWYARTCVRLWVETSIQWKPCP